MTKNCLFYATAFACFLLVVYVSAQQPISASATVSQTCLGCICEATSGCNITIGCVGDVCGPFLITWGYWFDSGEPTLPGDTNTTAGAYARCVNTAECAARSVEGYMNKFGKDCNGDGKVNCDDYARIHHLGGYGCSGALEEKYANAYRTCINTFG